MSTLKAENIANFTSALITGFEILLRVLLVIFGVLELTISF